MKPLSVNKTLNGKVESVVSLNEVLDEDSTGSFEQLLPDEKATPDDSCDQVFRSSAVQSAIRGLTKIESSVIKLYFFEDMNFIEIAEKLEIDYKTVRSNFTKAMDSLKETFQSLDIQ
jgi:RNA polymerase sigma factor (sigma-70 family)